MSHHDEQIQAIVSSATHGRDKALAELQHEATKAELAKQGERRAKDAFDDAMELVGLARWAEPFPSGPKHTRRAAPPLPPGTTPPPAPGLPPAEVKSPQ